MAVVVAVARAMTSTTGTSNKSLPGPATSQLTITHAAAP
jgi:hypothetical protein